MDLKITTLDGQEAGSVTLNKDIFGLEPRKDLIQPPLAPGTAPSIRISPRSTSTWAILRLSVVMRSTPM